MNSYSYLVPLIVGFAIAAIAFKIQIPRGMGMSRPTIGISLIIGGLLWAISCAMLLVHQNQVQFTMNAVSVIAVFTGLAFFLRPPAGATRVNQHVPAASALIFIGVLLGLAHGFALKLTISWPVQVIKFYETLGIHRDFSPLP